MLKMRKCWSNWPANFQTGSGNRTMVMRQAGETLFLTVMKAEGFAWNHCRKPGSATQDDPADKQCQIIEVSLDSGKQPAIKVIEYEPDTSALITSFKQKI